jgi:hypothetical protein
LSHLKTKSIKVSTGDTVKKGQVIAQCGNTGRSPVPHIHFQLQATPFIGSKTLDYPISHYIHHSKGVYELRSYETPENNVVVSNINTNSSLFNAFHFIPGQQFNLQVTHDEEHTLDLFWEVQVDGMNNTFLYCEKSRSYAYFRNDGDIHYFTHFEGDRLSLLFRFYLGAYKVMMGYYRNLKVNDQYPVNTFSNPIFGILQDFAAPFVIFTRSEFSLRYLSMNDALMQSEIRLESTISAKIGQKLLKSMTCNFYIGTNGLEKFSISENDKITEVRINSSQ